MGTPEFAVPSLAILLAHGYDLVAVVTAPDKPRGRGQQMSPTPIKEVALRNKLLILQPASLKEEVFLHMMKDIEPDLMVVVAFRILPRELFRIPRLGAFNLHASLLPRYRGAAPINWAIINGEKETGVSTFFLQEKVDTGKVILQARVPILPADDAGTMHDKLAEVGAEIVLHTVRLIEQGKAVPRGQDNALATDAPKIFREDCCIDWNQPALAIHNRIRGLSPYPTAYTQHSGKVLKLYRSEILPERATRPPGTAEAIDERIAVATSDNLLSLLELQQEGRKRMGVKEFLRGYRIAAGDVLGK